MKSLMRGSVVIFGIFAMFQLAQAGFKQSVPVSVGTNYGEGSSGTARNSVDTHQSIGCNVQATSGTTTVYATCEATDSCGTHVYCTTTEAPLVSAAQSAKGDSYIHFMFDGTHKCTEVWVDNDSSYVPKSP